MTLEIRDNKLVFITIEGQVAEISQTVILELWNGKQIDSTTRYETTYEEIKTVNNIITGTAMVINEQVGTVKVIDEYENHDGRVLMRRKLSVIEAGQAEGLRLRTELELFPSEAPKFEQLRYFAPPAIFDKNDLDDDGYEDYFHTKRVIYRDDRFNYPMFMAYSETHKQAIRIERAPLPTYDSIPNRVVSEETNELQALFLQKTDIGSLGVEGVDGRAVRLVAEYPFYEGDATIGLYIIKTIPFGAFWPMDKGEEFTVAYDISSEAHVDFHEACWTNVKSVIIDHQPEPRPLQATSETLVDWRLRALDEYYIEKDMSEDVNEPAGYVLNCHPQDGKQLENIIQYGFTGQNILNAYNVIRYGDTHNNPEYVRKAVKVADFFSDVIHIPESGMFYNLYNVGMKKVNFWWTGLLLPLAYAHDEELESLMGPLYDYRKEVIDCLTELEGAYLRCMNEDVTALLRLYQYEKKKGNNHDNWWKAIQAYSEFLLRTQEKDGGWFRAYDLSGEPILEPEIWFGRTIYEQKSSTGTSISFLVEMYQETRDKRYLDAAEKAGHFVKEYIIDRVKFNGGVHDSIYAKGQLIDNESILYPMFGMLSLYEETKKNIYLEGAHKAARFNASWVCLWDVPLPSNSTLVKYDFNSIGLGACDTCGCGYIHPFQLMGVAEVAQIAVYTKDKELLEVARLYWLGCNQTVALPEKDWGYAKYGLQEEGYLVSWWATDDPMFSTNTGFGYRLKGEGNKTCFPWINAVGVKGYWSLLDRFETTDFEEIKKKYFQENY